jgi:hypothetical protein
MRRPNLDPDLLLRRTALVAQAVRLSEWATSVTTADLFVPRQQSATLLFLVDACPRGRDEPADAAAANEGGGMIGLVPPPLVECGP